jgi:multidrug transporter EmrE-like cation transporter
MTSRASISPDRATGLVQTQTPSRISGIQWADLAVLGSVLLAACGHLMIKAGLNGAISIAAHAILIERLLIYFRQPLVVLGLGIYGIGTAMWIFAVSKHDISYVFPITALNYVLVTVGGMFLFSEVIPLKRWLGICVVIIGVAMMQSAGRKGNR